MSGFQTFVRKGLEIGAVGTAALTLAGCGGGDKPKVSGEFRDGVRTQFLHLSGSGRLYTEVIQQCDGQTLVETTTDVSHSLKDGKTVYTVAVHLNSVDDSKYCADGKITPEDFTTPNDSPTPATTNSAKV